jgi:hypothetical protein
MITGDKNYVLYMDRVRNREFTLGKATMDMVAYFIGLGDDQATAEDKVGQISDDVAAHLYQYTLGRIQPLLNGIQASTLPFMDQAAKDKLIGDLTPTT